MLNLLKSVDVIVLPSYREGLSKSLTEAASMSLPIITTNVPGCIDVVKNNFNGFICEVKSISSLKDKIKKIIELPEDERLKMGRNGRKIAISKFDEKIVIKDYYKVGIASSLDRVKKRLTTYRSSNPTAKIKFFSEIGSNDRDIEWSFKNKFSHFRVNKSECYKLDLDVIYKHFLKFQHKHNKLHHFWEFNIFYLSEYYFDKEIYEEDHSLSERSLKNARFGMFEGFIPIARLERINNEYDKQGKTTVEIKTLDIKNVNLKEYRKKYKEHLDKNFYGKPYGYISSEFKNFCNENFTIKKKSKVENIFYLEYPVGEQIFEKFESRYKSLTKKYPKDPIGCRYWEKPEQKHIIGGVKSFRLTKKIIDKFTGKHSIDSAISAISSAIPKGDPELLLQTFQRIIISFSIRAPRESKLFFEKLEKQIEDQIDSNLKRSKAKIISNNYNDLVLKAKINRSKRKLKNKYLKVVK